MASGKSLLMRYITPPPPEIVHQAKTVKLNKKGKMVGILDHGPYVNLDRDTHLSKKARKRGRRGRR